MRQKKSTRIKTKSKNLSVNDPHFTSLETLYEMNITLLKSRQRETMGWGPTNSEEDRDLKNFIRFRPLEEYINRLYAELEMYWEQLLIRNPGSSSSSYTDAGT